MQLKEADGQPVDSKSPKWQLGDGTPVTENELIALIAQHRQAVANYRGALSDHWQPFRGAKLAGIDLADLVLRAASLQPVVYGQSRADEDTIKDRELPLVDFSDADLREAELSYLIFKGADFSGATLADARMVRAQLLDSVLRTPNDAAFRGTDLRDAGFVNVSAVGTKFYSTNLIGARLLRSNFERAMFVGVKAQYSTFAGCNLADAWLYGQFDHAAFEPITEDTRAADERQPKDFKPGEERSRLIPTIVRGAIITADLEEVRWQAVGAPNVPALAGCENLHTLRSVSNGVELVLLRKYFSEAGLEEARRKITYALRRQQMDDLWDNQPDWADRLQVGFEKLFFEWPSRFGMDRKRPLELLGLSIVFFWPFYLAAVMLRRGSRSAGIWEIMAPDEANPGEKPRFLRVGLGSGERAKGRSWFKSLLRAVRISLEFSVQTAFTLGYRDINVGAWLARLRTREYALRPTGWVRPIAGIQSLVSFYLLVIWVLSYFGHPFE